MSFHLFINGQDYTNINQLIENYIPFIIKQVSTVTKRYVSIENDETFSVGLLAFYEAIRKYDESKGNFLSFAQLVISSRIKNYLKAENNRSSLIFLEDLPEFDLESYCSSPIEDQDLLYLEIEDLNGLLKNFGFTLEHVAEEAPKHTTTRQTAIELGYKVSTDSPLVNWMYTKKRLPITQIIEKYHATKKIIHRSKKFIITVIIIFDKNFRNLKLWIRR